MESKIEVKTLENHVFEAIGHASMCWTETPKGVFDTEEATKCGEELLKHINNDVPNACGIVFKALREDEGYYYSWQANIAMAFKDLIEYTGEVEGGWADGSDPKVAILTPDKVHKIANQAAKNFLNLLIKPTNNE